MHSSSDLLSRIVSYMAHNMCLAIVHDFVFTYPLAERKLLLPWLNIFLSDFHESSVVCKCRMCCYTYTGHILYASKYNSSRLGADVFVEVNG